MQEKIREVLSGVIDPNTGKDLVSSKALKKVTTEDGKTTVQIELDYPAKTQGPVIEEMVRAKLVEAGIPADVKISQNIIAHEVQRGVKVFDSVRNIIAVSSGKGGVGKSTVSANLALALQQEGAKVGLLDADVYGPSQPTMLGITDKPYSVDGKTLEPMIAHGLQVASVGVLIDPDQPMIWRGPLAVSALQQLLKQTNWKDLDTGITYEQYCKISDKDHIKRIIKMPVNFLVKSGKGFFLKREDSALVLRDEMKEIIKNSVLAEQMKDVIEYRVMDYYRKRYIDYIKEATCMKEAYNYAKDFNELL